MYGFVGVLAAVLLLSAYLLWTARRVVRLHVRAESAARALDAHLLRRAAAAAVVAESHATAPATAPAAPTPLAALPGDSPPADPLPGLELYAAARIALDARPDGREAAENDLTRQLRAVSARLDPADPETVALLAASRRVALARQVHTDLVRDALLARNRPVVRLFRMARRHPRPAYFDIVDPTIALPAPAMVPPVPAVLPVPAVAPVPVAPAARSAPAPRRDDDPVLDPR